MAGYQYSLTVGEWALRFDYRAKAVILYDVGNYLIIITITWQQCGPVAAVLVSLKALPNDEHDRSLTLSH